MQLPKLHKGFTLLEVLMVILIIALLMAFIVPQVLQGPAKARDVVRTNHVNTLAVALESYLAAEGKLPASGVTCITPTSLVGDQLIKGSYISATKFPADPLTEHKNGTSNCLGSYEFDQVNGTYEVRATLESGKPYAVNGQ